ncbi:MAG: protein kinase [Deltaproteobacteria bacterium]|nr:protein kinase [Deltaproteobacteria bacterium]
MTADDPADKSPPEDERAAPEQPAEDAAESGEPADGSAEPSVPDLSDPDLEAPSLVPPSFEQTISRSELVHVGASIAADQGTGVMIAAETATAHIPIELLSRDGKEVSFTDAGELALGEPLLDHAAYDVEKVIGRGGMGVVCAAVQKSLGREVAIKVARKIKSSQTSVTHSELEQFSNEAYVTARLDHPNVVSVHSLSRDRAGRLFFTMNRVSGISWEQLLNPRSVRNRKKREEIEQRAERMRFDDHLDILLKVADAVAYAHGKQTLHRDIKPENVMLGAFGEVLLMDWGLAMGFGDANPFVKDPDRAPQLVGTPAYLAPEMARGEMKSFGPPTDIYLLGGILYRLLTGRAPHQGEGVLAAVRAAARGEVVPPDEIADGPHINREITRITMKALAPQTDDRYQSVKVFQEEIRAYLAHDESLSISTNATRTLERLRRSIASDDEETAVRPVVGKSSAASAYGELSECMGAFRQALRLWDGNRQAADGLVTVASLHVQLAMNQGDLTLARSQLELLGSLDEIEPRDPMRSRRIRARVKGFASELEKLEARRSEEDKRVRRQRRLVRSVVLLLMVMAVAGSTLVLREKQNAMDSLRTAEKQHALALESQRRTEQLQRRLFAQATASRAALIETHLTDVEWVVAHYREQAEELLSMPAAHIPHRPTTPAGRDGYYLAEDFDRPQHIPRDMTQSARYGHAISAAQPTVKLAPWAQRGPARKLALEDARRLCRLNRLFARIHQHQPDVLYSIVGAVSGVLVSFPGSDRFRDRPEYDPTRRPWYLGALESKAERPIWIAPHVDAGGQGLLITCASPVRVHDEIRGVVGLELSLRAVQSALSDFTERSGRQAHGLLIRADGQVVVDSRYDADPAKWKVPFEIKRIDTIDSGLAGYWRGARAGDIDPDIAVQLSTATGPRLVSHASLPKLDWILLVSLVPEP